MTRALVSIALIVVVLGGSLVLGAVNGFCEDTDPWPDDDQ